MGTEESGRSDHTAVACFDAALRHDPVTTDQRGESFSRRSIVLTVANQDGGAHVDPTLDAAYAALSRENSLGWHSSPDIDSDTRRPFQGNVALPSVRQIAYELEATFAAEHGIERPRKPSVEEMAAELPFAYVTYRFDSQVGTHPSRNLRRLRLLAARAPGDGRRVPRRADDRARPARGDPRQAPRLGGWVAATRGRATRVGGKLQIA